MSDLPDRIIITEEGPREGFQIEPGPVSTQSKVSLIESLSDTGLSHIQVCSFVSPKLVPGWADADAVVEQFRQRECVRYTALWFNQKGIDRALTHKHKLFLSGTIHTVASESFSCSNLNRSREQNLQAMRLQTLAHLSVGIHVDKISVMAAFGCNFSGDVDLDATLGAVTDGFGIANEAGVKVREIALADTMGWANPLQIQRVVSHVRNAWPDVSIRLHLHDTRGLGIANAYAALQCGVDRFDSTVGGLGGCPFAASRVSTERDANKSGTSQSSQHFSQGLPPGNIATEELVLLAMELGIDTGIDLDALIDAGHLAEHLVGHQLPSAALRGGGLSQYRNRVDA